MRGRRGGGEEGRKGARKEGEREGRRRYQLNEKAGK